MKNLSLKKMENISGGLYECTKLEGNTIKIFILLDDANQLNGWLTSGPITGHISCHQL